MTRFSVKLSNILGLSFYRYELTSSTYNPTIDTAFTITVKVTDIFGNNISGKQLTLYHDGTSVSNQTTNSNGIATWTITPTTWGTHDFNVSNKHIQVQVDGWKQVYPTNETMTTFGIFRNKNKAKFILNGWTGYDFNWEWKQFGSTAYASTVAPTMPVFATMVDTITFRVNENGVIHRKSTKDTTISSQTCYLQMEWAIG